MKIKIASISILPVLIIAGSVAFAGKTPISQPAKAPELISLPAASPPGTSTAAGRSPSDKSPGASATPTKNTQESTVLVTKEPLRIAAAASEQGTAATIAGKTSDGSSLVVVNSASGSPVIRTIEAQTGATGTQNYRYIPTASASDPYYSNQWALANLQAPAAWDITTGSSNVVMAVIDSGVLFSQTINGTTYSQPDFPTSRQFTNSGEQGTTQAGDICWTGSSTNKSINNCDDDENGYIDDLHGWDFIGGFRGSSAACPNYSSPTTYQSVSDASYIANDNDPQPYSCDSPIDKTVLNKNHFDGTCTLFVSACTVSHGTSVASVAASTANDGNLIAGLDQHASIMSLRVFDGYGYTDSARIASAIDYATANGADVINLSLSYTTCNGSFVDSLVEDALSAAKTAGVTIVAASGNNSATSVCYPASSTHVIGVGASTQADELASFSSYGDRLAVVAPGESVLAATAPSSYSNSTLATVSGTSFASPYVAAIATLLKAHAPSANPDQIKDWITQRADIISAMDSKPRTNKFGYGRANAYTALRVASGDSPVYRMTPNDVTSGRDDIWTDDIERRNSHLTSSKYAYAGILFWNDGGNYDGDLVDHRNTNAGL